MGIMQKKMFCFKKSRKKISLPGKHWLYDMRSLKVF